MSRSRRLVPTVLALAALALAAPAGAHGAECAGADVAAAEQGTAAAGRSTLCLVNAERTDHGLAPLGENARLTQASQAYSELMVADRFFAHATPGGVDLVARLKTAGYLGGDLQEWAAGENLAWGERELGTPRSIVAAWMDSPGHRANILSRSFDEIGLGVALGTPTAGSDGATYTTDFGHRRVSTPRATAQAAGAKATAKSRAKARARKKRSRAHSRRGHRSRAARVERRHAPKRGHRKALRAQFISG